MYDLDNKTLHFTWGYIQDWDVYPVLPTLKQAEETQKIVSV